jgi:parvulin-like peptidyl-prolyl isomerase
MSSWYEKEHEQAAAGRDLTKWIWGGVAVLVAGMLLGLLLMRAPETDISQVQVRHILLRVEGNDPAARQRSLELATQLKDQLATGASFEELARKYSGDPGSAQRGGYLGWNPRGVFTANFEAAAWSLPIGQLSDIVQTEFGFHIIEVMDRKIAKSEAYDAELDRKARELNPTTPAAEAAPSGSE